MKQFLSFFKKPTHTLTRVDIVWLVAGLALFAAISLCNIGAASVWFDESFSAYIIRFSYVEIWQYTAADVHPPLYYWLLKTWSVVFGTSDVALRSMSIFFGGVAITFAYLLMYRMFGRRAARYSLVTLALMPFVVRYSQEMRMYTLVAAIALAATWTLVRALGAKDARRYWVLYGVLVSLGMWTHYFTAIVWLAHWAWRAVIVGKNGVKRFWAHFFTKEWIWAHVLAVGIFLPWLPAMVFQVVNVQANGFWIPPVTPQSLVDYFTNTLLYRQGGEVTSWFTLLFIVVMGLVIGLSIMGYRQLRKQEKQGYVLLLCLVFVPLALLVVSSMPPLQSSFVDRYLVTSSFVVALLLALALSFSHVALRSRLAVAGVHVLVIGALILGVGQVYANGNYNKITGRSSGAKQVMAQIGAKAQLGEPVVADSMWLYYDVVFYSSAERPVYFVEPDTYRYGSLEMLRTQDLNKIKDVRRFLATHNTFWYVGQPGEGDINPPAEGLKELQALRQDDPVTGKPSYVAKQYQVIAE